MSRAGVPAGGFDVVVVGAVGIDTNVFLPTGGGTHGVEGTFTDNRDVVGQAGGFSSRGFAALGARTAFVGHVGDDFCGAAVRADLAADGIDLTGLFVDPAGTARSVNLVAPDGTRRNYYDGRGHTLRPAEEATAVALLTGARLALFHLPDWARRLLPAARAAGAVVACDLQDLLTVDDPYRRDFVEHADVLFFSAANHADPRPVIESLLRGRPDRIVLSGMGARGCAVGTADGIRVHPPADLDLPVVDTNGAGDALTVGFLASHILAGHPLDTAVRRAQIAARWACAQRASSATLITLAQLDTYDAELS